MIAAGIFWISILLMCHSYLLYPVLLAAMASVKKKTKSPGILPDPEKPTLVVMLSVYNGQRIIEKKIESIFQSAYPARKLFVYVGSDCSDDETNSILQKLAAKYPQLRLFLYSERRGKIKVMNDLFAEISRGQFPDDSLLIATDVSAFFHADCLAQLSKHFQNPLVGLVGAHLFKGAFREDGISFQEKTYYERELRMKEREGILWGAVMGAFGACYAIRKSDYKPVPSNFLVDDFYMTMLVLRSGKKAIQEPEAVVYMDIPNDTEMEFGRKVRISAGNFQNMAVFWPLLFRISGLSFAFWSHKLIRWFGPFFIVSSAVSSIFLYAEHPVYQLAFWVQSLFLFTPAINYLLERLQVHLKLLKFVAHFYLMNLGILEGFIQFTKGIKNNVWTPTQR